MRHQRHIGLILVVPMSATICHIWGDNHTWHRSLQAFPQTTTWLITIIASYPGVLHIMYQDQQLLPLLTYLETVTCIPLQCRNTRMTHQHHLFLLDLNHHTTIPLLLLMPCQIFTCLIFFIGRDRLDRGNPASHVDQARVSAQIGHHLGQSDRTTASSKNCKWR
jgi:hypothetical protein